MLLWSCRLSPSPENCAIFLFFFFLQCSSPLPMALGSHYFRTALEYGSYRSSVSVDAYYLAFCSWLISPITLISRFIHIVTFVMISFPLRPNYVPWLDLLMGNYFLFSPFSVWLLSSAQVYVIRFYLVIFFFFLRPSLSCIRSVWHQIHYVQENGFSWSSCLCLPHSRIPGMYCLAWFYSVLGGGV